MTPVARHRTFVQQEWERSAPLDPVLIGVADPAPAPAPQPVAPLDPVLTGVTETFFVDSPVPPLDPVLTGVAEPTFAPDRRQHTYANISGPTPERAEPPAADVSAGTVLHETKTVNGSGTVVPRPRPMRARQRTIAKADAPASDSITRAPQLPTVGRREQAPQRPPHGAVAWYLNP